MCRQGRARYLTQADYVFIIDPWWNPAAESQAIARAHRIGQDKQVIAYRFIVVHISSPVRETLRRGLPDV